MVTKSRSATPARHLIRLGAGLLLIVCLVSIAAALWPARIPNAAPVPESASSTPGHSAEEPNSQVASSRPNTFGAASSLASAAASPAQTPAPGRQLQPTPESRRLVQSLVHLDSTDGSLTAEQAPAWKQNLQQLVQQGALAVPAIEEFLAHNTEFNFSLASRQLLGYDSARMALLNCLAQIGGSDALNAMTTVLQTTAQPREIALLAQDLEQLEPGQHRDQVLDAARQTLDMASSHKLEMPDVAPLFEVLQKYGGQTVVGDLEKVTAQWNYYGTIALAQLPDGAGIPSLVQMAQNPNTSAAVRDGSLQALAEVSDRSADARSALLALARLNLVSTFTWQMVASTLAGDQVGLLNSAFEDHQTLPQVSGLRTVATSDNQNFFAMPASLTPEQANQRIALIDELLSGTSDPAATQALQQSKALLSRRFADKTHS